MDFGAGADTIEDWIVDINILQHYRTLQSHCIVREAPHGYGCLLCFRHFFLILRFATLFCRCH